MVQNVALLGQHKIYDPVIGRWGAVHDKTVGQHVLVEFKRAKSLKILAAF